MGNLPTTRATCAHKEARGFELIDRKTRPFVYSDFENEIGEGSEVELHSFNPGTDMTKFRAAPQFVEANRDHIAIRKLWRNEPLTAMDLSELERMFAEAGSADSGMMERLRAEGGRGIF